ncbi:MAG TPA: class II fructose-bisphosphatase [Anaerolineae bacterium]|nr:class II fructose-bisphosphatase [Anaerolineae bacterium]
MGERPQRNLGMDLVRVTEAAALAAARWMGRGQKEAGDQAAVDAMRLILDTVDMDGVIVIGEGEKDQAPMLYNGERVGSGRGPEMDVAVDPVEGTRLLAEGKSNSIAVIAVAPRHAMWNPGPAFYMQKLVVDHEARAVIDLDAPVAENLRNISQAKGMDVDDLTVFILDRPRHQQLIAEVRAAGARITLHTDGDVAGALLAVIPGTGVDVLMGIGGTPEGIIAACAVKAFGGGMLGRLAPQKPGEREAILAAGQDLDRVLTLDDLVRGEDLYFAATGITTGDLLQGVRYDGLGARTHSVMIRARSGTVRYIEAIHRWDKLMRISTIDYD